MKWQIVKQNAVGKDVWQYDGTLVARIGEAVLIDARFDRDDFVFNGMPICRGDRFIEAYYADRWFNIMEIYEGGTDTLKGWYCNVTYPANIQEGVVTYKDLALDVMIFADQRCFLLDEDEFEALGLPAKTKEKARKIPNELLLLFQKNNYQSIKRWFDQA
jgi:protein associated with RNAse G/E